MTEVQMTEVQMTEEQMTEEQMTEDQTEDLLRQEELDKELEKINPSIKNAPNLQPKVVEEEIVTEGDGIKYDLNIINNSKKRKIIIKKPEVKATSVSIMTEEINKE